mgnify:CR=1 FL=1
MAKFKQGKFVPKNPLKYMGNVDNIVYRSSWEYKFMLYLDFQSAITKWASEELYISYFFELDNKVHKYYPDFYFETTRPDGSVSKYLIEIKPQKDMEIVKPKKMTEKAKQNYMYNAVTVMKNEAKWKAARAWCEGRNIVFKVLTENELFGGK